METEAGNDLDETSAVRVAINGDPDVVMARTEVRLLAERIGFELIDQTRLATAASELATNILRHARAGVMRACAISRNGVRGMKMVFVDEGPGIAEVEAALTGQPDAAGNGKLGLAATRAVVDELQFASAPGEGTTIMIRKWIRR